MVSGRFKSRTFRRIHRRVPSGESRLYHILRKPKKARCSVCNDFLKGIARERASEMKRLTKTRKTVSRPYGGNLCSRCMREKIKENIRAE